MSYVLVPRPAVRRVGPPLLMRGRRRGLRGLGVDCSQPVLRSNYYSAPCTLGQGAATEQCLAAQDAAQAAWEADWAACNQNSAAGVNPNQIIGVPGVTPTETLYQAAKTIYGGTVPTGTFQNIAGGPGGTLQNVVLSPVASPVPPSAPGPASESPAGSGSGSAPSSGGVSSSSGSTPAAPTSPDLSSLLTGSAFFGIPNWALAAAALGAVFVFSGGHR